MDETRLSFNLSKDYLYFDADKFAEDRGLSLETWLSQPLTKSVIDYFKYETDLIPIYYSCEQKCLFMRHELMTFFDKYSDRIQASVLDKMVEHADATMDDDGTSNFIKISDTVESARDKVDKAKFFYDNSMKKYENAMSLLASLFVHDCLTPELKDKLSDLGAMPPERESLIERGLKYFIDSSRDVTIIKARKAVEERSTMYYYETKIFANNYRLLLAQFLLHDMSIRAKEHAHCDDFFQTLPQIHTNLLYA